MTVLEIVYNGEYNDFTLYMHRDEYNIEDVLNSNDPWELAEAVRRELCIIRGFDPDAPKPKTRGEK